MLYIKNGFFAFLMPFFEALLEIEIALQIMFLREKLMYYKKQVLEDKTYFHEVLQKRASKTQFFFDHQFRILSKFFKNFNFQNCEHFPL